MSHIITNFKKWSKLFEQNNGAILPTDFAVFVGTDKTPVSDSRLNQEHNYELAKDGRDTANIYELTLAQALSGEFANAKRIGKTIGSNRDSIEFGKTKLHMSGTIEIIWSDANKRIPIRVSGNGALALARIARVVDGHKITKEETGSIIITMGEEVAEEGRYAKFFSIIESGADVRTLDAKISNLSRLAFKAVCNKETKRLLDPNMTGIWSEQNYSNTAPFGIKTKDKDNKTIMHFPNRKVNPALSAHYGKYSDSELRVNSRASKIMVEVAKIVKASYIDIGLDSLSNYISPFFQKEFSELPEKTVARLTKKIQINIASVKKTWQTPRITTQMLRTFRTTTTIKTIDNSTKMKSDSLNFAPGKS